MPVDPFEDAALRYALRLDGVSRSTAKTIYSDILAALRTVRDELARRTPEDAPFTVARLALVQRELDALRLALADKIGEAVGEAVKAAIDTTNPALADAFARLETIAVNAGAASIGVSWVEVPVDVLRAVSAAPYDGKTWADWGRALGQQTVSRIESELRQAAALGEGIPKVAKRLQRVADLSRTSADALARTALADASNRARMEVMKANAGPNGVLRGYRFSAVLDGRVSAQCRALSGREFETDAPNIPRPPLHPRCRSLLVGLTRSFADLLGQDFAHLDRQMSDGEQPTVQHTKPLSEVPKDERKVGTVKAGTTYESWLKTTDESFQREVLGATRYRAWKRGLPLSAMATYDRELSIAELRRMYPNAMSIG